MNYNKQNFEDNQVLTAGQLNHMEDGIEAVSNNIGDISQLSTEEKGSLVEAINELFQSANNGKQIIADAIGSPLSSDDTFAAMGEKIDAMKQSIVNELNARGVAASIDEDFNTLFSNIKTVGLISLVPGTSGTYLITHFSKQISCSGTRSASCEGEINIDTSKFKLDGVSVNISSGTGLNVWYSVTQYRNGALYKTHINGEYVSEVNKINKTLSVYDVQQGDIFRLSKTGNGSSLDFRGTTITVTSVIAL